MNPVDNSILNALLSNDGHKLFATENSTLEFKSSFEWSDNVQKAKYLKTIAALCNNEGGYLIFGIDDKTKEIKGITEFDKVDSASIANHLGNYFSPSIKFHKRSFPIGEKEVGVIYVERYSEIPSICIRSFEKVLQDGAFFFRYSGKSDYITGPDLVHYLHSLKSKDSKEIVDLKKQEMKMSAMPKLILKPGMTESNTFNFTLKNARSSCRITDLKIKNGEINLWNYEPLPRTLDEGESLTIQGATKDGVPAVMKPFLLELIYSDAIGTQYKVECKGTGGAIKISEPVELN